MYDQLDSGHSVRMVDLKRGAVPSRFVSEVASIRTESGLREVRLVRHPWGAAVALACLLTAGPAGVQSATLVGPLLGTDRWLQDADGLVARLPEEAKTPDERKETTDNPVTVYVMARGGGAMTKKINEAHMKMEAEGWRFADLEIHTWNGDTECAWITYTK